MGYIGGKIASGAAWMLFMRFIVRSIGLISTVIVARLLSPEDFGLVALATSVYALVEFLGAFGFGEAIIQRHDAERGHYDTAWTLNLAFGLIAGTVLALMAGPVAHFFEEPRLESIIYVLAGTAFIERSHNTGVESFKKELQMGKVFQLQVAQKVVAFFVTVSIAIAYQTYWALVLGIAGGSVAYSLMSFWVTPFRPRPTLSKFGDLFGFSKWLFLGSVLSYVDRKAGPMIMGKLAGTSSIGFFSVSQNLSNLPALELVKPLNQALFPGYSKIKNEPQTLRRYYLKALSLIALVVFPAASGLAVLAPSLVPLLLGPQWDKAIPVVQVLAIAGIAQALAVVNMSVHLAVGQPHLPTVFNALKIVLLLPALGVGVFHWGVMGAALAYLGVNFLLAPLRLWVVKRSLSLPGQDVAAALWRPMAATVVMAGALGLGGEYLAGSPPGVRVAGLVVTGVLVFSGVVIGFWRAAGRPEGGEEYVIHQLRAVLPGSPRYG